MNNLPSWSSEKKIEAREQTIITPYREVFGTNSIPEDKQYFTMCGQSAEDDGSESPMCEFHHMTKAGFIKPSQFYGVELFEDIHRINVKVSKEANWIHGDFYMSMIECENAGNFNPAIVNADLTKMPERGTEYLARIAHFLSKTTDEVLLIGNFILRCYTNKAHYQRIADGLLSQPLFKLVRDEWRIMDQAYLYAGAGKTGSTDMGTIVLWKKP